MADDPRRNRYAKNPHLWRRVYSFRRRKPQVRTYINPATNVTHSLDLNKTVRHRDFFIIRGFESASFPPTIIAEYDEGIITFSNTSFATAPFNFCFSGAPDAVVLTVDDTTDNTDNIIAYGLNFTSCSMSIGTSAPFSGNIRYRAARSPLGYPAQATSSLVPSSGTFTIFAGHVTASNVTTYSINYNVEGTPTRLHLTPWDFFTNFDIDVDIAKKSIGPSGSNGQISAPLNNPIYFIAVK